MTITGTGFVAPVSVSFGGVEGVEVHLVNSTSITVVTPPGTAGNAAVTVTHPERDDHAVAQGPVQVRQPHRHQRDALERAARGRHRGDHQGQRLRARQQHGRAVRKGPRDLCELLLDERMHGHLAPGLEEDQAATGGGVNVIAVVGKAKSKKTAPADEFIYEPS